MGKITTSINGRTTISGVIGYPLTYTLSPSFHNSALNEFGVNSIYLPFIISESELENGILGFKAYHNMVGLNVTNPHKQAVIPFLDEIDKNAENICSVNTIKFSDGKMTGYSTDGDGFLMSLAQDNTEITDKTVIILGTGGAARAIAAACIKANAKEIIVVARRESTESGGKYFTNISESIGIVSYETLSTQDLASANMVINCTPIGQRGKHEPLPIDLSTLKEGSCFYDLNYNSKLELPKDMNEKGIKVMDGKLMLLFQAALSFKIFYDLDIKAEFITEFSRKSAS